MDCIFFGLVSDKIDVMEIPSAIRNYIQHFFACRKCSMNFIKETHDIDQLDRKNSLEAVKYLWKGKPRNFVQDGHTPLTF